MYHKWSDWEFDEKANEDIITAIKKVKDPALRLKLIALKFKWN